MNSNQNKLRKPRITKVVVNIGTGSSGENLKKAMQLLEKLTNQKPIQTKSKHKIPDWGLRKGLPIGCKVTLRGKKAEEFFKRALDAVDYELSPSCIDNYGNLSFGIEQYVFFEGVKYDPAIGTMGLQLSVTIERAGTRIAKRRIMKRKIPLKLRVSAKEAKTYLEKNFNVKFIDKG
jgi:large subunit ribosomal protein L5